jgi:hypothetical protein
MRNAARTPEASSGDLPLRNPIVGIGAFCARASIGNATAALPKSEMNSRRLTGLLPGPRITLAVDISHFRWGIVLRIPTKLGVVHVGFGSNATEPAKPDGAVCPRLIR